MMLCFYSDEKMWCVLLMTEACWSFLCATCNHKKVPHVQISVTVRNRESFIKYIMRRIDSWIHFSYASLGEIYTRQMRRLFKYLPEQKHNRHNSYWSPYWAVLHCRRNLDVVSVGNITKHFILRCKNYSI